MPKYKNPYAPFVHSKYKAQKTVVDGIEFDSKKEANRYSELKLLEKAGEISGLELQKTYNLIPAAYRTVERYGKNGQRLKDKQERIFAPVDYRADFVYTDKNGETVVEDVKGFRTKEYIIKKKLMYYRHGIIIKEV